MGDPDVRRAVEQLDPFLLPDRFMQQLGLKPWHRFIVEDYVPHLATVAKLVDPGRFLLEEVQRRSGRTTRAMLVGLLRLLRGACDYVVPHGPAYAEELRGWCIRVGLGNCVRTAA